MLNVQFVHLIGEHQVILWCLGVNIFVEPNHCSWYTLPSSPLASIILKPAWEAFHADLESFDDIYIPVAPT
jgi:hypothetical protein